MIFFKKQHLIKPFTGCLYVIILSVMKLETRYGKVKVSPYLIAQVVSKGAFESYGVVALCRKSLGKKIKSLLLRNSVNEAVQVDFADENLVNVKIHIFVEYGVNIPEVTRNLADRVSYDLKKIAGVDVGSIEVVVEGVKS